MVKPNENRKLYDDIIRYSIDVIREKAPELLPEGPLHDGYHTKNDAVLNHDYYIKTKSGGESGIGVRIVSIDKIFPNRTYRTRTSYGSLETELFKDIEENTRAIFNLIVQYDISAPKSFDPKYIMGINIIKNTLLREILQKIDVDKLTDEMQVKNTDGSMFATLNDETVERFFPDEFNNFNDVFIWYNPNYPFVHSGALRRGRQLESIMSKEGIKPKIRSNSIVNLEELFSIA